MAAWNAYFAGWLPDTNFFYHAELDIVTGGVTSPDLSNACVGYGWGTAKSSWYLVGGREHLQLAQGTRVGHDLYSKDLPGEADAGNGHSQFNDDQAAQILTFLNYEKAHRKVEPKAVAPARPNDSVAAGREFYVSQNCSACHTIGAEQASGGPSLDAVGRTHTREQLLDSMKALRSGTDTSMPPLPSDTSDAQLNSLVDYLLTLRNSK